MSGAGADSPHLRLSIVGVVVISLFAVLFARLWFLQIMTSEEYAELSQANRVRVFVEEPPRGRILDANGAVVVDNRTSLVVTVDPNKLADLDDGEPEQVLDRLAGELTSFGVLAKVDRLERRLGDPQFNPLQPIPMAIDVPEDFEVFLAERSELFPGVAVRRESVRTYPHGVLGAHLLGYVGRISQDEWEQSQEIDDHPKPYEPDSNIGKTGIERSYEDDLRGVPGRRVVEVDAEGRVINEVDYQPPRPGSDLVLTLDIETQARAEAELAAQLESTRGTRRDGRENRAPAGAVVLVDPTDSSVLAMASYPTYDPADFVNGISTERYARLTSGPATENPLTNRAISGLYAPGSTFKPFTAVAALQAGMITPESTISDGGTYSIENCTGPACTLRNAGGASFGNVDLERSLTVSSNVYYFWLGDRAYRQREESPSLLQDGVRQFGFGTPTGIELTGEAGGVIPDPDWKRQLFESMSPEEQALGDPNWYPGDAANIAVGQGDLLATPLQMANAYAAIANGGTLHRPHLVDRVLRAGGAHDDPEAVVRVIEPEVIGQVDMAPDWIEALDRGLRGVTTGDRGTARAAFEGWDHEFWPLGSKTGTAEVAGRADSSLFAAYGPAPDPRYTAFVVLEESGFGGEAAAPLVRRLFAPFAGQDLPESEEGDEDLDGDLSGGFIGTDTGAGG